MLVVVLRMYLLFCGRCKHYFGLARVNFLLFLVPYQLMPKILSTNACKLSQMIGLLLLNYWTIPLWRDNCQVYRCPHLMAQGLESLTDLWSRYKVYGVSYFEYVRFLVFGVIYLITIAVGMRWRMEILYFICFVGSKVGRAKFNIHDLKVQYLGTIEAF